jgi:hypothetical protein
MIGVVAHDAGGAEVVSSYLRRNGLEFQCCLEGPALGVFVRKFGSVENIPLSGIVAESDWLLCGTSFLSDLEWGAVKFARQARKRAVSAVDHWVNYRQRFFRHGEWCFPNEVWVGDEIGLDLARKDLPEVTSQLVPNPYFLDLRDEIASIDVPRRHDSALNILFVCEPVRDDGLALYGNERHWGYTEEEALTYFLDNVGALGGSIGRIVVRAHPQEPREKYNWAVDEYDLPIVTNEDKTLLEQVVVSDVIAGCASMALVVGLLAGKRVVSCIPPGATIARLPHKEIESLCRLREPSH